MKTFIVLSALRIVSRFTKATKPEDELIYPNEVILVQSWNKNMLHKNIWAWRPNVVW